jgi:hypothetical protein
MTIRKKLTLAFVGIAVMVPAVSYYSFRQSQAALEGWMGESSAAHASELLAQVNQSVDAKMEWFREFSKAPLMQEAISESNRDFSQHDNVQTYLEKQDAKWFAADRDTVTPFMKQFIENPLGDRLRQKMQFYQDEYNCKLYGEIFITNKYGANVAQTSKTSDYYQGDEEWWQLARKNGLYISDAAYEESSRVYATEICIRIDDAHGEFAGVLKAVLNIDALMQLMQDSQHEAGGARFALVDGRGNAIYPRDGSRLYSREVQAVLKDGISDEAPKSPHYATGLGGQDGQPAEMFAWAHSNERGTRNAPPWVVVIRRPMQAVLAPLQVLKDALVAASIAVWGVSLTIGLALSTRISRRLAGLSEAVGKIGQGRFDANVAVAASDEIGQIEASLRELAARPTSMKRSSAEAPETRNRANEAVEKAEQELAEARK